MVDARGVPARIGVCPVPCPMLTGTPATVTLTAAGSSDAVTAPVARSTAVVAELWPRVMVASGDPSRSPGRRSMDVPVVVVLAVSMVSPDELFDVSMVEVDVPSLTVTRSATLEREMFSRSAMNAPSATPAGVGRAAPALEFTVLSNVCTGPSRLVTVGVVRAERPDPKVICGREPAPAAAGLPLRSCDAVAWPQADPTVATTTGAAG